MFLVISWTFLNLISQETQHVELSLSFGSNHLWGVGNPTASGIRKFHQTHSNRRINGLLSDWFFPADLCDQEHPDFNSLCHLEWAWSVFCRHIRTLCLPRTASLAGGFRLSHDHLRGHSGEYLQPSPWLMERPLPGNSNGCPWRIPWNWSSVPNPWEQAILPEMKFAGEKFPGWI